MVPSWFYLLKASFLLLFLTGSTSALYFWNRFLIVFLPLDSCIQFKWSKDDLSGICSSDRFYLFLLTNPVLGCLWQPRWSCQNWKISWFLHEMHVFSYPSQTPARWDRMRSPLFGTGTWFSQVVIISFTIISYLSFLLPTWAWVVFELEAITLKIYILKHRFD